MAIYQTILKHRIVLWIKDAFVLAKPYWQSEDKFRAMLIFVVVVVCDLATVYLAVRFSDWNSALFNALQKLDKARFINLITTQFIILSICYSIPWLLAQYFQKILIIRWRRWMSNYYIKQWFTNKAHYKAQFLSTVSDNPDQRISEDINNFISLFLDLTIGLLRAIVAIVTFSIMLWKLSGSLNFNLFGHSFTIPGYIFLATVIYVLFATYLNYKVGYPLIKLDYDQQLYEANFRYNLLRVRENKESIAFYDGEVIEEDNLRLRFNQIASNFIAIINRTLKINIFNVFYSKVSMIFIFVAATPKYFLGIFTLGTVMQINYAFTEVGGNLSFFITSFNSIASWRAVMDRLLGFQNNNINAATINTNNLIQSKIALQLSDVSLNLPNGKAIVQPISLTLNPKDRLLIMGASGGGKTTLLRAICGLWPFYAGKIYQNSDLQSLFIAQKPYLPVGNLKKSLCYPNDTNIISDYDLIQLLHTLRLNHLDNALHKHEDWSSILSIGEQQKINFARILINKPDIVFLDEASSALDEDTENFMYQIIIETLPSLIIISVGHRSALKKWHGKMINLTDFMPKTR